MTSLPCYFKRTFLTVLFFTILSSPFSIRNTYALQAVVPETGQTTSYAAGDDGDLRPGLAWPAPRFTDNPNGTVTDNLTGLIWLKNANCFAFQKWEDALASAKTLDETNCALSDHSSAGDWRLPNRRELASLVDASRTNQALPSGHPFNVQPGYYWSSSSVSGFADNAWAFHTNVGGLHVIPKANDSYVGVWPVRGGQFGNSVIAVTPTSINFGAVPINTSSAPQTITIRNTATSGSSRLQINALSLRGANPGDFTIDPGNGSLGTCGAMPIIGPGASCTATATFTPSSVLPESATLRVSGSDLNAANVDIAMFGNTPPNTVTGSVNGGNGSISSTNPVQVASGSTATFILAPNANYQPSPTVVTGCPAGSWSGNIYTTGTITANCTAVFSFQKITYPLTITYFGTGSGTVAGTPSINCPGTCGQFIDSGTPVNITATANGSSVFSGWSGCPAPSGNLCPFTMTSPLALSVYFNLTAGTSIKVNGATYGTISGAYANAGNLMEISLLSGDFYENLVFGSSVSVTVQGGYSSNFSTISGVTTIHGSITISGSGTVTFGNIVIK